MCCHEMGETLSVILMKRAIFRRQPPNSRTLMIDDTCHFNLFLLREIARSHVVIKIVNGDHQTSNIIWRCKLQRKPLSKRFMTNLVRFGFGSGCNQDSDAHDIASAGRQMNGNIRLRRERDEAHNSQHLHFSQRFPGYSSYRFRWPGKPTTNIPVAAALFIFFINYCHLLLIVLSHLDFFF